jgi:hypothetical protein
MKITVLTNVFNEEYLMPFWLEHHRSMFDHGIVFDWGCTDRSMDIVREMCPTWEIRKAIDSHPSKRLEKFDAFENDILLMVAEMNIEGYKIVLNTTEFLMTPGPIRNYLSEDLGSYYPLRSLIALSSKESQYPTTLREFFDGVESLEMNSRKHRMIHSWDHGHYSLGRHEITLPVTGWIEPFILWCGCYPWNSQLIQRGLQIKDKIPDSDYEKGISYHHRFSLEERESIRNGHIERSIPVSDVPNFARALM